MDEYARELETTCDRLRTSAWARPGAAPDPGRHAAAEAAHDLAVRLAELAETVEAGVQGRAAVDRALPRVPVRALADQLAVTGGDLHLALEQAAGDRSRAGALAAADVARDAVDGLRALRGVAP